MARYTLVIGDVTDGQVDELRWILARKPHGSDQVRGEVVRINHTQAGQIAEFFGETQVSRKDAGFDLLRRLVLSCTRKEVVFQRFGVIYDEQAWATLRYRNETFNGGEFSIFSVFCASEFLIREGKFYQLRAGEGDETKMRSL